MYGENNSLSHYGIKNMKWGIRNYQNKDGSLTTLGRIRYRSPRGQMIKKSVDLYENFPKRRPGESDKAFQKRYGKHDSKWASSYYSLTPTEQLAADNEGRRRRLSKQRRMAMKYAIAGVASGAAAGAVAGPAAGIAVGSAVVVGAANTADRQNSIQAYIQNRRNYKKTKKEIGRQVRESLDHDDLCHYGIKGQKRGVRRYQNTDGSLTPAGKQHYGIGVLQLLGSRKDNVPAQGESSKPNLKIGLAAGSKRITATMNSTGRMNSEGRLTKWRDRRRALSYAKGARERSGALKAYDKTGNASGKEAAESRMSIAGRDLSGAAKAAGISRLQNRTAIGKATKAALYTAAGVGASLALANPAPLALGAASIKNLIQANRARKKSKMAKDYAKEHYDDDSDYLPENIVDVENRYYRYHPNRRHAKHADLAHFGIKNMKWGQRRYQNMDGSLTPAGKIRYGSPKSRQIREYGQMKVASNTYNKMRGGIGRSDAQVIANAGAYRHNAKVLGQGLTAAEKAAGYTHANRQLKAATAAGAGIAALGGLMGNTVPAALATGSVTTAAAVMAAPAAMLGLGGYMIREHIRARRAGKLYGSYARENYLSKNPNLPGALENYDQYSPKVQRQIYRDYKRDHKNINRKYNR